MITDAITSSDLSTILTKFQESIFANLRVSLPAEIVSFDPVTQTASVQPTVKQRIADINGNITTVTLPLLVDCPVQFPTGGNVSMTFPIKAGDECLVIFSDKCIDFWWQNGGVQEPIDSRLHDLSDGFVLVGYSSKPKVISEVSQDSVQIRTNDGANFIELKESGQINIKTTNDIKAECNTATINALSKVDVTAESEITLRAAQIALEGLIQLLGNITGGSTDNPVSSTLNGGLTVSEDVLAGAISLINHTHPIPSGGSTGKPQ